MSFGKNSSIVFIMNGNKLIGINRTDDTADKQPLDTVESEIMRIVNDYNHQAERIKELKKEVEELRLVLLRIDNYCRVNDIDLEQFLNEPKCKTCNDIGKIYPEPIKQNGGEEHQSPPQSCPDCKHVESIEYYAARPELDILKSKIDRLEAENKKLKDELDEHQWIPVSERLPEQIQSLFKSEDVYATDGRKVFIAAYNYHASYWQCPSGDITHWKPIILPEQALKETE